MDALESLNKHVEELNNILNPKSKPKYWIVKHPQATNSPTIIYISDDIKSAISQCRSCNRQGELYDYYKLYKVEEIDI